VAGDDDGTRAILGRSSDVSMGASDARAVFIGPDGSQVLQAEFADKRLRQYHVRDFVVRLCR